MNVRSLTIPEHIPAASLDPFETLFRAHYERVARVIGRVIHDQARAEEIAVEVFLKWRKRPDAQLDGAAGWLYKVAIRKALDEWRRKARWARVEKILAPLAGRPGTPEQVYERQSEQTRVQSILASLDARTSSLLILWSEDASYREIATTLDINPGYVGSLLSRAQTTFRKEYVKRYGTE